MNLNRKLSLSSLREKGIQLFQQNPIGFFGEIEIEGPTFCAAQLRFDTLLRIGAFCSLNSSTEIGHTIIGRYTSIAQGCFIGGDKHPTSWLSTSRLFYVPNFRSFTLNFSDKNIHTIPFHETGKQTIIGNDVLIAYGCVINRGVTIGNGAVICAGSVVTQDIPPYAIAGGSPARIIKYRFPDKIIEKIESLNWWRYNAFDFNNLKFNDIDQFIIEFEKIKEGLKVFDGFKLSRQTVNQYSIQE